MIGSAFSSVHDFFHSSTWFVVRNLTIFFVIVFWIATIYWVYKDSRRRVDDKLLVGVATLLGVVPFIGPLIYMLFRPPEFIDDRRERELEMRAIESRLAQADVSCPVCRANVDPSFLVCPVCTTKLKQACSSCNAPLEPLWQICPYCETPMQRPKSGAPPALGTRRTATTTTARRRASR